MEGSVEEYRLSILNIIDRQVAHRRAQQTDPVGQMVRCVLNAANPDAVFQDLARQLLSGYISETRKLKITMLAAAFGADRDTIKGYLRAHAICGPVD